LAWVSADTGAGGTAGAESAGVVVVVVFVTVVPSELTDVVVELGLGPQPARRIGTRRTNEAMDFFIEMDWDLKGTCPFNKTLTQLDTTRKLNIGAGTAGRLSGLCIVL
jgi:hypothetical protein